MKKAFMIFAVAMVLVGMTTGARASFSTGDTYTVTPARVVSFYLVDWGVGQFDNTVVMTADTSGGISGLKYSLDNKSWLDFTPTSDDPDYSGTLTISNMSNHTQLIYLKYVEDTDAGSMKFISWTDNSAGYTNPAYLDLFTSLKIKFDSREITIASNAANDKFAPVPIPPSAYMLGAGLLGLVGLRRRIKK